MKAKLSTVKYAVRLPAEYQEVEYLEATGGQYIELNYYPDTHTRLVMDYQSAGGNQNQLFDAGAYSNNTSFNFYVSAGAANYARFTMGSNWSYYYDFPKDTNRHRFIAHCDTGIISMDNFQYTLGALNQPTLNKLKLITSTYRGKLFIAEVYSGVTSIYKFIPCYRKSDNEAGFYDLVNGVFYTNQGTGSFTVGADKLPYHIESVKSNVLINDGVWHNLPAEYQEVEYIESTGTQYIDTGIYPTSEYSYELTFSGYTIPSVNQENIMFGVTANGWSQLIGINQSKAGNRSNVIPYVCYDGVSCPLAQQTYGIFKLTKYNFYYNDTIYFTQTAPTFSTFSYSIYLFCANNRGDPSRTAFGVSPDLPSFRCSEFKIWNESNVMDNTTLEMDLIPCYRKSDDVAGMYDLVSGQFYTNAGTGSFIVGNNVSLYESKLLSATIQPKPIYGVSWVNDSTTTMTRTDNAVGKSYIINSTNGTVISDFDNLFPWNEAEIITDNAGNKFLHMPDMYFRIGLDENNDINAVAVSKERGDSGDWYLCKSFDYGLYGASLDTNDNKLYCQTNSPRINNKTRAELRAAASNNSESGYVYHVLDLKHRTVMVMLWWIEFATKNSKTIMQGNISGTFIQTTGGTDGLTTPSGYNTVTGQMRYHYIEDFVGNLYDMVEGIQTNARAYWGTDNPAYFADNANNFTRLYAYAGGYNTICAFGWSVDKPFLCMSTKTLSTNDATKGFCGFNHIENNYAHWFWQGTRYSYYADDSLISSVCSQNASYTWVAYGCRLLRQPTTNFNQGE